MRLYLIQHSAGSGKSNSIAWLAYWLSSLHNVPQTNRFLIQKLLLPQDEFKFKKILEDKVFGNLVKELMMKKVYKKMNE